MNNEGTWKHEILRALCAFTIPAIFLLILAIPVHADNPVGNGDWVRHRDGCNRCTGTSFGFGYGGYLPTAYQSTALLPQTTIALPQVSSPVQIVRQVIPQVVPQAPPVMPTVVPTPSPTPVPTPVPTPAPVPPPVPVVPTAPAPTVQGPVATAPDNEANADTVSAVSMATRPDVHTNWASTIVSSAPEPYADCLAAINAREDPDGSLHQQNLQGSPATGLFQFMPGTWASTSVGQQVSLYSASVDDQINAAVEMLQSGRKSAWAPVPTACAGVHIPLSPQLDRMLGQ